MAKFLCLFILDFYRWEEQGQVSREVWMKAGEVGLLGTDTATEHGGLGGDFKDVSIIIEEQYVHGTL